MKASLLLPAVLSCTSGTNDAFVYNQNVCRFRAQKKHSLACANGHGDDDDICRQTLGHALQKMMLISQPGSPLTSKYNKRRLSSIEVKESSIPGAGLGLFAKKSIKSGTVISFYPAHVIGVEGGDDSNYYRVVSIDASGKTHEKQGDSMNEEEKSGQAYLHHILGNRPIIGVDVQSLGAESIYIDVDINQDLDPSFGSHWINDGAVVSSNSEDGVLTYYQESRKAKNCVHVPFGPSPLMTTVTTKVSSKLVTKFITCLINFFETFQRNPNLHYQKVSKGEELFTTYGCSYWLEYLLKDSAEEVETDMTDAIILEAKDVARDVFNGMKSVELTNSAEARDLEAIFLSIQ
jgi:hypothetical protein